MGPCGTSTSASSGPDRATPWSTNDSTTGTSRSSSRTGSVAPASTSDASRARCTSTRPDWPGCRPKPRSWESILRWAASGWSAVRDRIFGRIDEMEASGRAWREKAPNVTVYAEPGRFVGPRRIAVGTDQEITAERVVVAAGARPVVPEIPGLDTVDYHTSDTIMRLPDRPSSLLIIGGGYVAAEFAHVFSAYGTDVTVVNRSERLLRREDDEIAERFTELFGRQVDLTAPPAGRSRRADRTWWCSGPTLRAVRRIGGRRSGPAAGRGRAGAQRRPARRRGRRDRVG